MPTQPHGDRRWPTERARLEILSSNGPVNVALAVLVTAWLLAPLLWLWGRSAGPLASGGVIALWLASALVPGALAGLERRVSLGADGIRSRTFGRERFLAYSCVVAIEAHDDRIELHLDDGARSRIRLLNAGDDRSSAFLARLRELWEAARAPREERSIEAELARGGRSVSGWLDDLEARASAAADYRERALDRAALLAVVEDPHAEPSARSAAAWLLRRTVDAREERERIGAAAQATAHPRVRVVLEALAQRHVELARVLAEPCSKARGRTRAT